MKSFIILMALSSSVFANCNLHIKNADLVLDGDRAELFRLSGMIQKKGYTLIEEQEMLREGDFVINEFIIKTARSYEIKGAEFSRKNFCAIGDFWGGCQARSSMAKSLALNSSVLLERLAAPTEKPLRIKAIVDVKLTLQNDQISSDMNERNHGRFIQEANLKSLFKLASVLPECGQNEIKQK